MSELTLNVTSDFEHFALDIKLTLPLQGIIGIFGHSGSGKTTLLKSIAGLTHAINGTITYNETTWFDSSLKVMVAPEHRQVMGVFQQDGLFPHLSVLQNLEYAVKRRKTSRIDTDSVIDSADIRYLLDKSTHALSGGERQKVAIARALLADPNVLILDEPVTALDRINKTKLLRLIKRLQKAFDIPILYVSHNLEEIQALADHVVVMSSGKVINQGPTHQVIHQLNHSALIEPQTSLNVQAVQSIMRFGLIELAIDDQLSIYGVNEDFHNDGNDHQRCFILAKDISVCRHSSGQSSIVNQVKGEITAIETNKHQALITVNVQQHTFYASISTYSLDKLALACGESLYLQFKASAIRQLI